MSYVFDLGNPATNANPFPEFARLRAEDPVHWSPVMKAWIVTRYADVKQVALNNRQISADRLTPFHCFRKHSTLISLLSTMAICSIAQRA